MDKLAYHYNKKKLPAKIDGKILYYYPCDNLENATVQMGGRGFVTIEVTEKEWEALLELDRIEYNNEHKYVRHTVPIPDEEGDLTVKQQEQLHAKDTPIDTATAEFLDKKSLYAQLTADEARVLKMLDDGSTQKKIASELGVTQGYVSAIKTQAQFNYDYLEYCSAVKTCDGEFLWKCWNLFTKKLEMPMFLDVEIEFVLRYLYPKDVAHFLHWYYSLGEFIRFTLNYYLYNEDTIEKEKRLHCYNRKT